MKITNFAIIFILIFFPFYLILDLHISDQHEVNKLNEIYSAALRTAVQDSSAMLNQNELQEYEAGYQSPKYFNANKEIAIDTFFRTMYLNFEVDNDYIGQGALASYIPAVGIIDYKGFHIYAFSEYQNSEGQTIFKHMWRPQKPYSFADNKGNSVNFTLDQYVYAFDASTKSWIEGYQPELQGRTNIDILNNPDLFESVRRSTIVKTVQTDLAYYINKHNEYASHYGVTYNFKLPEIPMEDWTNTIDDIGVLAFVQGIPIGDQYYNNFAFGGGRLVKQPVIYGAVDQQTGLKYYYRDSCSYPYRIEEAFSSEKEAAAAGYFPKECFNGSQ
ncbi:MULTISPECIES: hypothetical protein [Paenibacillus]|uniref:F0F1-type ATP synthase n=2 Tax=Paenibacillus TaxID=44249 RepID=A0A385U026_PAELA|nr:MULTISPECIES: hypothetical protein [Paenibacillus]AWP25196.1 hypothetical protein B9D94_00495 [Paenibacillus sp. Cedars]AYB48027.1 hypothetical protein D5F53_32385 [Paenibacillus lautus]VTR62924.1 Uncharacterised protein [Actinobacillus pleuropneumoniae]